MGEFIQGVQIKIKKSSVNIITLGLRILSGLVLGLTFAIAGQEIFQYGVYSFWFVIVTLSGVFLKISQNWTTSGVLVFNLVCVMIGMLLRMYVVVAPGA